MSQKINPISFRLGLFQVWNTISILYGKSFDFYCIYKKLKFINYLKKLLLNNRLILDSFYLNSGKRDILIFIKCIELYKNKYSLYIIRNKITKLLKSFSGKFIKIYFFKKPFYLNSAELLTSYAFITSNRNIEVRQILKFIFIIAIKRLNRKKVFFTTKGLNILKLKGLKIKSKGRFENSRNQMSKIVKFNKGSSALPSLKNYVEYSQVQLYTKSGICSLHVWLFYAI